MWLVGGNHPIWVSSKIGEVRPSRQGSLPLEDLPALLSPCTWTLTTFQRDCALGDLDPFPSLKPHLQSIVNSSPGILFELNASSPECSLPWFKPVFFLSWTMATPGPPCPVICLPVWMNGRPPPQPLSGADPPFGLSRTCASLKQKLAIAYCVLYLSSSPRDPI